MSMRLATAKWADPALVEEKYLYREGSVWMGRSASDNDAPLGYSDDRHVCLVSGTRGGKGTSVIVNNLCLWPGSVVVVDPKGENATITAARRGAGSQLCDGMGQTVHLLDPFKAVDVNDSCRSRFNPLDALKPDQPGCFTDAGRIADAIVVIHDGESSFWDESGRSMIRGLILHVLTDPAYEGRRNLLTVRWLISRGDWEAAEALRQMGEHDIPSPHALLWMGVARNPAFGGRVAAIGEKFIQLMNSNMKGYGSVVEVASLNTEFIESPEMEPCLEASDFELSELKTRPEGMSLYLSLPLRHMETHYRWLRMMIGLTLTEMERVKGQPASGHPVLFLLDEFAGLDRMKSIEKNVAQMAGYGVKMFFILQTLEQLKATYKDNWETFISCCGLKLFFNLEDHFSREYVSKLIGETEIMREVHSSGENSAETDGSSETRSRSRTESTGDSVTRGRTLSEGSSSSSGWSESEGTNESFGTSHSGSGTTTWGPGDFFPEMRSSSSTIGGSDSTSHGKSKTSSRSGTQGTSRGSSDSTTHGTSHTSGSSEGESFGTSRGTSRGQTSGTSETVHRRPLISPDEIGQLFARIDDRGRSAYPGMGLAVIAGQRPVAFRRVNYYEDIQFIGYFDAHPDHEFSPPAKYEISWRQLAAYEPQLPGVRWVPSAKQGALVRAGDWLAEVHATNARGIAAIRAPRAGRVVSVPLGLRRPAPPASPVTREPLPPLTEEMVKSLGLPAHWVAASKAPQMDLRLMELFSGVRPSIAGSFEILYYEDGKPPRDPFAELDAYCAKQAQELAVARKAEAERKAREQRAAKEAAQQRREERATEIWDRRRMWLQMSAVAGIILLLDIGITIAIHSIAGILIGVAAAGFLVLCGVKISQTLADDQANVEPPAFSPALENFQKYLKDRAPDPANQNPLIDNPALLDVMWAKEELDKMMTRWKKK